MTTMQNFLLITKASLHKLKQNRRRTGSQKHVKIIVKKQLNYNRIKANTVLRQRHNPLPSPKVARNFKHLTTFGVHYFLQVSLGREEEKQGLTFLICKELSRSIRQLFLNMEAKESAGFKRRLDEPKRLNSM